MTNQLESSLEVVVDLPLESTNLEAPVARRVLLSKNERKVGDYLARKRLQSSK